MRRLARRVLLAAWGGALAVLCAWAALAVVIDAPLARWAALALAAAVVVASLALAIGLRPRARGLAAGTAAPGLVLLWWLGLDPSMHRDWTADVARTPTITRSGDLVTVTDLRDFHYRTETDFDVRWETRTYDLSKLTGVDMYFSFWGPTHYAHTITSWEFSDGRHLAISVETRKERGETYSALAGFFRRYELHYVAADERDVIGLRARHRGETVRLYRLRSTPQGARELLLDYAGAMNALARRPAWYNALTTNCTTVVFRHLRAIGAHDAMDWRVLANGHLDALGYELGAVDTTLPLPALRAASDITERARRAADAPDFSARIRVGLPARPPPRPTSR